MSEEQVAHGKKVFLGSYFGLFLGWLGLLAIAAGVTLALRGLDVFSASRKQLIYWGSIALGGSGVVYGLTMFAMTWSFARRRLGVHFLPAAAFAVWGAIPICNLMPVLILAWMAKKEARPSKEHEPGIPSGGGPAVSA